MQLPAAMRALVVATLLSITVTAHAGNKPAVIAVPPVEAELGAMTPLGTASVTANSTELRVGVHSASLYWKPTRFDVGIGYTGSFRTQPVDGFAARGTDAPNLDNGLRFHGIYASFAYAIERHRHWRTWLGGRLETLHGDYQGRSTNVFGASVRVAAELFSAGVAGASGNNAIAFMAGTWALGVYVEGTARTLPDELGPVAVGAGMTMRVPFLIAGGY